MGIYVVGDVMGYYELILVVIVVGCCLLECFFNNKKDVYLNYENILIVVFSYLVIGMVGLIELEVIEKYGKENIKVYIFSFILMYIVIIDYCEFCWMKLICEGKIECVIGLYGIGYGVDEMI